MGETSIEWAKHSINPIRARHGAAVGHYCEKISAGCKHCYSSRMQPRFKMPTFENQRLDEMELFLDESKLNEVLRRRKPTRYFWCSMTDIFGHWVPYEMIDRCLAVMALTPQHTHIVLTKRAKRMCEHLSNPDRESEIWAAMSDNHGWQTNEELANIAPAGVQCTYPKEPPWPLPNVHLYVSCEDQKTADERIPLLLQTPAAVRGVSLEPLLGPIQLPRYMGDRYTTPDPSGRQPFLERMIDHVIVGGESGHNARPCNVEWIRSIVSQCREAGVAIFVKQDSGPKPGQQGRIPDELWIKELPNG